MPRRNKEELSKYNRENLKRLKVLQRRASKKKKDSANRKKAVLKVAKHHEKISNKRNDFLHNLTHRLTNENQVESLAIEDLNVAGLWSEFFRQLEMARQKLVEDRQVFEPSSRTCDVCGTINHDLKLSDRTWLYPCGAVMPVDEAGSIISIQANN